MARTEGGAIAQQPLAKTSPLQDAGSLLSRRSATEASSIACSVGKTMSAIDRATMGFEAAIYGRSSNASDLSQHSQEGYIVSTMSLET